MGALGTEASRTAYAQFYAYLHTIVDAHVGAILDALDAAGLTNDTVIIRTADHGELGLSHKMTEKSYTAYEEATHVPFIVSNPVLFPTATTTSAFYDHLDLLPTVLDLVGVANPESFGNGIGRSVLPVLRDVSATVRDHALFTFDDVFGLPKDAPGSHIRSIRFDDADGSWTYSVYFSPTGGAYEYELYDLKTDADQLHNLTSGTPSDMIVGKCRMLHAKLTDGFTTGKQLPGDWPVSPWG